MGRKIGKPIVSPDYVTPSELLYIHLTRLGMTQTELAMRTGVTKKHINDIFKGYVRITADFALKLDMVFGLSNREWIDAQVKYDLDDVLQKKYKMKLVRKTHPQEVIYHYDNAGQIVRVQLQLFYRTVFQARKVGRNRYVIATLPIYCESNGMVAKSIKEVHRHMVSYIKWLGGLTLVHTLETIRKFDDGEVTPPDRTDDENQPRSDSNSDV